MNTQVLETTAVSRPRIIEFHQSKDYCWSNMKKLLDRAEQFATEFCPETIGHNLRYALAHDFIAEDKQRQFLILGALDAEYELCGHLIACVSVPPFDPNLRRCLILQYQVDPGANIPLSLRRAAFEMIVDWAKTMYCREIIAETKTEQAKRAFQMFYNFDTDIVQMRKAI